MLLAGADRVISFVHPFVISLFPGGEEEEVFPGHAGGNVMLVSQRKI